MRLAAGRRGAGRNAGPGFGAARLAGDFPDDVPGAADFFAAGFLTIDFFVAVFFVTIFFVAGFLAGFLAPGRPALAFFAAVFFAADFPAADFFAAGVFEERLPDRVPFAADFLAAGRFRRAFALADFPFPLFAVPGRFADDGPRDLPAFRAGPAVFPFAPAPRGDPAGRGPLPDFDLERRAAINDSAVIRPSFGRLGGRLTGRWQGLQSAPTGRPSQ